MVFRDGRIDHVPADDLTLDVDALLTDAQLAEERTAKELIAWCEERSSRIRNCPGARESASEHRGPFKKFYEELVPCALWLRHLYVEREDVTCVLNDEGSTHRDYDAVIQDHATSPPTKTYVQLTTTTFDRTELRRTRNLLKDGVAPAWGPPDMLSLLAFTREEKLKHTFDKIDRAVSLKSPNPYGPNYVLVVALDDSVWDADDDLATPLRSFVNERIAGWRLNVDVLYIVGVSGGTFESFPIPRR